MFADRLADKGYGEITTEIVDAPTFYYAEDYHQQYLAKNPNGYCGLGGTGVSCPIGVAEGHDLRQRVALTAAVVELDFFALSSLVAGFFVEAIDNQIIRRLAAKRLTTRPLSAPSRSAAAATSTSTPRIAVITPGGA